MEQTSDAAVTSSYILASYVVFALYFRSSTSKELLQKRLKSFKDISNFGSFYEPMGMDECGKGGAPCERRSGTKMQREEEDPNPNAFERPAPPPRHHATDHSQASANKIEGECPHCTITPER